MILILLIINIQINDRPSTSQVSMKGKMKKEVITCVVNEVSLIL